MTGSLLIFNLDRDSSQGTLHLLRLASSNYPSLVVVISSDLETREMWSAAGVNVSETANIPLKPMAEQSIGYK